MDRFKKKVYDVELYMLQKSSTSIKKDYSFERNVIHAAYNYSIVGVKLKHVLVYKSLFGYKEFITDRYIPCLKRKKNRKYKLIKKEPLFFKFETMTEATLYDIENYLTDNLNKEKYNLEDSNYVNNAALKEYYLQELNDLFKEAWNIYNTLYEGAVYSSEKARKKYEKKLDRNKIKSLKKEYEEIWR